MTGIKHVVVLTVGLALAGAGTGAAQGGNYRHLLTGTYQLDINQGDNPQRAAEMAARAVPPAQRERTYQSLLARLEAPEQIAIERRANRVSMASTRAERVSFDADGMVRSEQWAGERTMNTRVSLVGERLVVTTTGNRGNDFTVTFEPTPNGRSLRMTRTIDDERLSRPVTVRSVYRRLSNQAQWSVETSGRPAPPNYPGRPVPPNYPDRPVPPNYPDRPIPPNYPGQPASDVDAGVPDGVRLVVVLDTALNTTNSRDGDLYTMTALSPPQFEGAVIQGSVITLNDSRRMSGRAGMTLSFQSIRFRDGRSSQFDGLIESVRTPNGDTLRVDREGVMDSRGSQTQKVVERSVIGAALGAMIGAVAGGGKGAAIGAVIGAGGGAGTVMIEGRDRLDLPRGTELTIISGDPRNQDPITGVRR